MSRFSIRLRLLALALSLLMALLCTEVLLRVVRFAGPTGMFYLRDPVVGYRLRPGFSGWYRNEGEAFLTVNSDGMPDRPREQRKHAGTFRVAVVGDSFTEAAGVLRERRFSAVIERRLASCSELDATNVEVLSFGASGYGTAQELLEVRSHVWQYSPDILLLELFVGNDLRNNVRELNGPTPAPFFVQQDDSTLDLDRESPKLPGPRRTGWKLQLESTAFSWFRTLHLIQATRVKWRDRRGAEHTVAEDAPDTTFGFEAGADWQVFLPPQTRAWEQAWQVTEGLLRMMKTEAEARGVAFRVAAVPSGIQVHPDRTKRDTFRGKLGATSLSYPGDRLAQIANRNGIALLDLAPPMLAYAEQHQTALYGHRNAVPGLGHWNEDGHRVGGEAIADWMCARLHREELRSHSP
jgi:hypothetical protein